MDSFSGRLGTGDAGNPDILKSLPCAVSTVALGWAASAGQFLYLLHARLTLCHATRQGTAASGSGGIGGTAVDVELQAEDLRHTRDTLRLIAEDTGQSPQRSMKTHCETTGSPPKKHWNTASWMQSSRISARSHRQDCAGPPFDLLSFLSTQLIRRNNDEQLSDPQCHRRMVAVSESWTYIRSC